MPAKRNSQPLLAAIEAQTLARHCAEYAADKKAEDIVILDLRGVSDIADFYVLCTATSEPQLKAVRDSIVVETRDRHGARPARVQGEPGSGWIIVDFTEVMVHVLHEEKRELYALEQLWNDAAVERWEDVEAGKSA
jgi:ribosome-associated protein